MPMPIPITATLIRSFAPITRPVEGALLCPYTGVFKRPVAATAAVAVAVFLRKSRLVSLPEVWFAWLVSINTILFRLRVEGSRLTHSSRRSTLNIQLQVVNSATPKKRPCDGLNILGQLQCFFDHAHRHLIQLAVICSSTN